MRYTKNFDQWNTLKKAIHARSKIIFVNKREIWWCTWGVNIGHEIDGKGVAFRRPIIILQKLSKDMYFGVPTTTQIHEGSWYVPITFQGMNMCAIVSQARVVHVSRFQRIMGTLDKGDFEYVRSRAVEVLLK